MQYKKLTAQIYTPVRAVSSRFVHKSAGLKKKEFNDYARENKFLKDKDKNLEGPDTRKDTRQIVGL